MYTRIGLFLQVFFDIPELCYFLVQDFTHILHCIDGITLKVQVFMIITTL